MTREECIELELLTVKEATSYFLKKYGMEEYLINMLMDNAHTLAWDQYEEEN